ncbi:MAG: DUF3368 domain-containing protein [Candidatus Tectomicrobia bacterium]|nr:DUF3368 domain-containing protein [Candidatus Tectomicrobia bacterium]
MFRYLVVLEATDILPALFGDVLIPPAVFNELQQTSTPVGVRTWFANLPPWVRIQPLITSPDPSLNYLGDGEQEAIQLVSEQQARLLVTDDRQAHHAALARSLPVTRTLRVLEMAAERGLLDFPTIVTRL